MSPLTDRLRRATTLVLVVLALVLGPQLAFATFGSSAPAQKLQVGTATMAAPTNVTGTYSCGGGFLPLPVQPTVNVTGLVDNGPDRPRSYVYTLARRDGSNPPVIVQSSQAPSRATPVVLRDPSPRPFIATWYLTVTVKLASGWESPASTTTEITCATAWGSGSL
ncbi:hypothetical protein [Nocardioides sp. zg-DK7169]|uniref:hypothetical protein n=1 Tax=Nocardioides sp. zg-DK7169 TaxID=2736600 RepID=UPI0015576167|nr:hypothetical protein [Nocardioides sp. zg-DK7169]NPC96637.1 hypothetical protein [Nocardioides sp. zg-DK7169]